MGNAATLSATNREPHTLLRMDPHTAASYMQCNVGYNTVYVRDSMALVGHHAGGNRGQEGHSYERVNV